MNVYIARAARPEYADLRDPVPAPELPGGLARTTAAAAFRELLLQWGLDREHYGTPQWNPLGEFIRPGAKVVLKPNWVSHRNEGGHGLECLVTHVSVIEAAALYVGLASPGSIIVGDAPIQGCDFEALMQQGGYRTLVDHLAAAGLPIVIKDFRRTVMLGNTLGSARGRDLRGLDEFVEVDLGADSLLEPLASDSDKFRVAMYDPRWMSRTHAPGRHRYLIAKDVLEADVVVNLPKLKTHKKACVTGALKNMVGINGNKEYLPHYRVGGGDRGGDAYAGASLWKDAAERVNDFANQLQDGSMAQRTLARSAGMLYRAGAELNHDTSFEGSWHGNDTVWRMSLDLQRVLRYARADGSLHDEPQRQVLAFTDAIVGGEKDGPLRSSPIASGFLTAGASMPELEWVHTLLMGFDPRRVPLVRHAFDTFRWPLTNTAPEQIEVSIEGVAAAIDQLSAWDGRPWSPPPGWSGHCEAATSRTKSA